MAGVPEGNQRRKPEAYTQIPTRLSVYLSFAYYEATETTKKAEDLDTADW